MASRNSKFSDNPSDDICPVCKSNRYLNPSLQFLINPECYHKMCSTCVDRIFTSGPTTCPVPHCGKTLRKKGFHKAFFEDLRIEREVDIRRKVSSVFNRRENEFETLRDYNNYLEEVESLVYDLVEGKGKTRQMAERKLEEYRLGNMKEIEENQAMGLQAAEIERSREAAQRDMARQRRLAARKEEEALKLDVAQTRREALDQLAWGEGDANEIANRAQKVILKKASGRRTMPESGEVGSAGTGLTIRGLKKKVAPVVEKAYDPFGGVTLAPSRYVLQSDYDNQWLDGIRSNGQNHLAGGYSLPEYFSRTMFEAFSGLSVFIADEKATEVVHGTSATEDNLAANVQIKMQTQSDDVF